MTAASVPCWRLGVFVIGSVLAAHVRHSVSARTSWGLWAGWLAMLLSVLMTMLQGKVSLSCGQSCHHPLHCSHPCQVGPSAYVICTPVLAMAGVQQGWSF